MTVIRLGLYYTHYGDYAVTVGRGGEVARGRNIVPLIIAFQALNLPPPRSGPVHAPWTLCPTAPTAIPYAARQSSGRAPRAAHVARPCRRETGEAALPAAPDSLVITKGLQVRFDGKDDMEEARWKNCAGC